MFWTFAGLFFNLAIRIRELSSKSASILRLVEQAYWRMPLFTEWIGASFFAEVLAGPSRHANMGLLPLGLRVPEAFLSLCCMKEYGDGFGSFIFVHAYCYRDWNCNCLLYKTARWAHIANNIQESFVKAVVSPDSWPRRFFHNFLFWPQNYWFVDSARYFFFTIVFNSVTIKSYSLLRNLQVVQLQYGLEFLRHSYSQFVQSFQDIIRWDVHHWSQNSIPL